MFCLPPDADSPESQGAAGHQGGAAEEGGRPAEGGGHARLIPNRAGRLSFPLSHARPHLSLTGSKSGISGESSHQGHPVAPPLSPGDSGKGPMTRSGWSL